MTEEDAITGGNQSERESALFEDFFLAQLIKWANDFDLEQAVTLAIGGAVISGVLMSGRRYFEELAATVSATPVTGAPAPTEVEKFKSVLAEYFRGFTVLYDEPKVPDDSTLTLPSFVHLRDARWVYPNGKEIPGNAGVLWRGKISAVDGFCLGRMHVS